MDDKLLQSIANNLEFIKKALIIDLVSRGLTQEDVASLLGLKQNTVSIMFPQGILKKAKNLHKAQ